MMHEEHSFVYTGIRYAEDQKLKQYHYFDHYFCSCGNEKLVRLDAVTSNANNPCFNAVPLPISNLQESLRISKPIDMPFSFLGWLYRCFAKTCEDMSMKDPGAYMTAYSVEELWNLMIDSTFREESAKDFVKRSTF